MLSESVAHGRKNIRRSRACKARNEAQKKFFSGRSGFIGDGAKRFAGPFVTLRRSRTQDAAGVEQLRGHWRYPRLLGDAGFDLDAILAEDVSAEMSIRSASAGTSTTSGFTGGNLSCHLSARAETGFQRRLARVKRSGTSLPRHREPTPQRPTVLRQGFTGI